MTNTSILTLDGVTLALPDGRQLFAPISESFDQRRTGLVGVNGVGKSLLGQILAGSLAPSEGRCLRSGRVHYLHQHFVSQCSTVAELAQVGSVVAALQRIEAGSADPADFDVVAERWDIRERVQAQLDRHGLGQLELERDAASLSGGQAMRVALIGALVGQADYLILDEPSNHLDVDAREQLHQMLLGWVKGLLVISHDRTLLGHMQRIVELTPQGLRSYSGDYRHYEHAKAHEQACALHTLDRLKHERRRQTQVLQQQRESLERRQADAGRQARQANQAKILIGRQQQRSQATAGRQQREHQAAEAKLHAQLRQANKQVERNSPIVMHAPDAGRSQGKSVLSVSGLQLPRGSQAPLDLHLRSGEHMAVIGANGTGKSTLLKVLAGQLQASAGSFQVYGEVALLDQHYSLLPAELSALAFLRLANPGLAHSEVRTRLAQLGLDAARVEMPTALLSGGERLKAALAGLLYRQRPVDLLLLDEPSNHLDLPSLLALERMLDQFCGGLLVACHDQAFLQRLQLHDSLRLG